MPITASLGALSFPRNLIVQAITTDKGFSAIVPGYQFIPGTVSMLAAPLTGYTTASYTTHGVDVDSDGNMYFCGVKPGLGFPSNIPPEFGIFKLDYTTGAPIYDSYPVSPGGFYSEGGGISTAVNSDDKVNFAGYYFTGFSPINEFNRTYQVTSADLGTGYYQSSTKTSSSGNDIFGIRTVGSNYYLCAGRQLPAEAIGVIKINTSNVYQNIRGIRDNQSPVSSALNYRDFGVDSSENYYYLVNLSSGSLGAFKVLVKQNTSGTIVWAKSFNFEPLSFTVDSSGNVYTLVYQDQGSFSTFHIVKMNSSGSITAQNSYAAGGSGSLNNTNVRICLGSDGNLYTQLGTGITQWDTSLNPIWTNVISYIPSFGTYSGPIGNAGIVEYDGSVYIGSTIGYDGQECIYVNRLPSDGSLILPNKWWLGNGYGQYDAGSVTVRTPVATISVTDYIYLLSSSPTTSNSYEAANDPPSEDGLVINKQL